MRLDYQSLLAEVREKHGDDEYYRHLAALGRKHYWIFLRDILGYAQLDPWLHGEDICRFVDENELTGCVVLVPRGGGKTSTITIPRPAWWMAKDWQCSTVICNANENKALKFANACAAIVSHNETFRLCYPEIIPSSKWGRSGFYLEHEDSEGAMTRSTRADPALSVYGVDGNITGTHLDGGLILDDLVNARMAKSPVELARAEAVFVESVNCLDAGSPLIVCGTRWTYLDFYGKIIRGELLGGEGPMKVLKLGVTDKDGELIWPRTTYIDQKGKEKTIGYTHEYIESRKVSLGPLFSALYYNEPVLEADMMFDITQVKTYQKLPFEIGGVGGVGIESESQAAIFVDAVRRIMREEGRRFRLEALYSKRVSKAERIRTVIQTWVNRGNFNIQASDWRDELGIGEEMRTFDKGRDDCLDACSYALEMSKEGPADMPPMVYIAMDPAFTATSHSDRTAIVAVCKYRGEAWVLGVRYLQSDRTETLARYLFKMVDKFNALASNNIIHRTSTSVPGFVSAGHSQHGRPAGGWASKERMTIDIPFLEDTKNGV